MAQAGYVSCSGCGRMFKESSAVEMSDLETHDCENTGPTTMFRLHIRCDNPAFTGPYGHTDPAYEVARLLHQIADRIDPGVIRGARFDPGTIPNQTIFDANGNDVGRYSMKEED